jgi:hypothetical protein
MVGILLASIYFGNVYGMIALANTAVVYAVLYGFEKFNEAYFLTIKNVWIYIFTISFIAY